MIEDDWQDNATSLIERLLPITLATVCLLLEYLPIYIGLFNNIRPDLGLVAIYFWLLNRSDLFDLKFEAVGLINAWASSTIER